MSSLNPSESSNLDLRPDISSMRFATEDRDLDQAFRIALHDIVSNITLFKDGLLSHKQPVLMAGLDYDTPWTRDAAINTWNGAGLLFPEVTRNTLVSVLQEEQNKVFIAGQYWDTIIWSIGAWWQYLYTHDGSFLALAFEATCNTIAFLEATEFDPALNLFRGPACYGDGVSAYPDIYTRTNGSSSILNWPEANPQLVATPGYGLPMHALSTNCIYYQTYVLIERMAAELGLPRDLRWQRKAKALKEAINKHFWDSTRACYQYLVDSSGGNHHQEGLGHCFALLFSIADAQQAESIFNNQHITPHGIPCAWPIFTRYKSEDGMSFGRHSGTIWPHIQAFWAHAAALNGKVDLFEFELRKLAEKACQNSQFSEIYHPLTGNIYGGIQEGKSGEWKSCAHQTWSATGFIRMIFMGLLGMTFETQGILFKPTVPQGIKKVELCNLPYQNMVLDIEIEGSGTQLVACTINEQSISPPVLSSTGHGRQRIKMMMNIL